MRGKGARGNGGRGRIEATNCGHPERVERAQPGVATAGAHPGWGSARYKPDLSFYGKMDSVAIAFADKFPHWERSPLTVEVRNRKKHRRIFLAHRRCFFESDPLALESKSEFEFAMDGLERVCSALEITELQRIGVRQWIAADLEKPFALMVDEIESRFMSQNPILAEILSDKVTDLAYVVNFETTEGWKYNLQLGPMTREEWFQRVRYERGNFGQEDDDESASFETYQQSIPDNLLFIDVDCYQENASAGQLKQCVAAFRQRSHDLVGRLIQYSRG